MVATAIPISEKINIPNASSIRFVVPKFSLGKGNGSVGSNSGDDLTPHEMSIRKIMDLKRLTISSSLIGEKSKENESPIVQENCNSIDMESDTKLTNQFVVDLASALSQSTNKIIRPLKPEGEQFEYKFIDCDEKKRPKQTSAALLPPVNHACEIDIGHILNRRLDNRARRTTAFGKILCSRFQCKSLPHIKHEFQTKHSIQPFKFDKAMKFNCKRQNNNFI